MKNVQSLVITLVAAAVFIAHPVYGAPVKSEFSTEQHWMADVIASDIAQMIYLAVSPKTTKLPDVSVDTIQPSTFRVRVREEKGEVTADISGTASFWSSSNYEPLAKQLMERWQASPAKSASSESDTEATQLLSELATAEDSVLHKQNQRISKALNSHPLSADVHEQAALLLGALALQESSGGFSDDRHEMCRMAAHLAVAKALNNGKLSKAGQWSEVLLLTLSHNQSDALKQVEIIEKAPHSKPENSWITAMKLYNTKDWRLLPKPESALPIEQLALASSSAALGSEAIPQLFEKLKPKNAQSWVRLMLEQRMSVETGHQYYTNSMVGELESFISSCKHEHLKPPTESEFIPLLNEPAQLCVVPTSDGHYTLNVIGWGTWAAFHQRHLLNSFVATHRFLGTSWGVPDLDATFRQGGKSLLRGVTLFPIAAKRVQSNPGIIDQDMLDSIRVLIEKPELVNANNWTTLRLMAVKSGTTSLNGKDVIRDPDTWFTPRFPHGTAYDFWVRWYGFGFNNSVFALGDLQNLLALAPYDNTLIDAVMAKKYGKVATLAQFEESFALIKDYNKAAMEMIANAALADPASFVPRFEKLAQLDPNRYFQLGSYLAASNMPEKAVEAYEKAIEKSTDAVLVSNSCAWLVDYYFDHGQKDKAIALAKNAAEVYSHRGLTTYGRLLEKMAKLDEAEDLYTKCVERYGDMADLHDFYLRNKGKSEKLKTLAHKVISRTFPEGTKQVTMSDFKEGPPHNGVAITTNSDIVQRIGLKPGDIVVALDGINVKNLEQYYCVRAMKEDPQIHLIVWNGDKYIEVSPKLANRKLKCEMATYTEGQ